MGDPYLQSDGETLENVQGIQHDPEALDRLEKFLTASREAELHERGLPALQGFPLVKAIHYHLFQDVYSWAGQPRTTLLVRDMSGFLAPERIEQEGRKLFERLAEKDNLRGLWRMEFAEQLAVPFNELNHIHPFREGNGRTQRIVWEAFAREAGHTLDFEGISQERMAVVSIAGMKGDHMPAIRMFDELLDSTRHKALVKATRFLEKAFRDDSDFSWNERYIATTTPGQAYDGKFAGRSGDNFMMGSGDRVYIGNLADLGSHADGLRSGDQVSFRVAGETPASRSFSSLATALTGRSGSYEPKATAPDWLDRAKAYGDRQKKPGSEPVSDETPASVRRHDPSGDPSP
ncbi:hypothetical protein GOB93_15800 [Acetobacter musti]|uniref:protein adenylyltransferase n=1 Tax=Acetobacter musti TaxID=864732 RepID=A0ABX0JRK0_9PROT|nr:Fic family protein [Acetobacter musti]NHN86093.1 hypothetical protein [Acetobacter musti]